MEVAEQPAAVGPEAKEGHPKILFLALFTLFATTISSSIFLKLTAINAAAFPFVITELSPLEGLLGYSCVCLVLRWLSLLPPEARKFPKRKAAIVGFLFALRNVLENLGNRGSNVPGPLVLLIGKLSVPLTSLISFFPPLKKRESKLRVLAITTLVLGVALPVIIQLTQSEHFSFQSTIGYQLLLIGAVIPLSFAFVFVEVQLDRNYPLLSATYFWLWICIFQAVLGLGLVPFNAWIQDLPYSKVGDNIVGGLKCIFAGEDIAHPSEPTHCAYVPLYFWVEYPIGIAMNLSMAASTRLGGATLMWFVRAFALPVASLIFTSRLIMGTHAAHLDDWDWFSLAIVFLSLLLYNAQPVLALVRKRRQQVFERFVRLFVP